MNVASTWVCSERCSGVASVIDHCSGLVHRALSWRWVFYVNIPLGVAAFLVLARSSHLPVHKQKHRIDWLGAVFIRSTGTVMLLVAVGEARGTPGHRHRSSVWLSVLGSVAVAAFIWQEFGTLSRWFRCRCSDCRCCGWPQRWASSSVSRCSVDRSSVDSWSCAVPHHRPARGCKFVATDAWSDHVGRQRSVDPHRPLQDLSRSARDRDSRSVAVALRGRHRHLFVWLSAFVLGGTGLGGVMQVLVIAVQNNVEHKQLSGQPPARPFATAR